MYEFHFQSVANIISGIGSIAKLNEILTDFNCQKLCIVTDQFMLDSGLIQPLLAMLAVKAVAYEIFADVIADPSEQVVLAATNFAKRFQADAVIGFGGGSSMDVAKVVALLAHPLQTQQLTDLYGVGVAKPPKLPLILIPTTAGTGSEVTPISIVTTGQTTKSGIVSPALYADVAILDAQFTVSLPAHITAATGIDAMVHAIEAYTSKIKKNFYSDQLAKQALRLLHTHLKKVMQNPDNLEARQAMLIGSMLAGQAFANAPVAAVHALAYPLGGHFHIAHGHSNALVLTEVMKFNHDHAKQYYAELMQHIDPYSTGCISGLSDLFIDHMQEHVLSSGLKLQLRELGVAQHHLEILAKDAMQQTRLLQNNPRNLTVDDAYQIYAAIY